MFSSRSMTSILCASVALSAAVGITTNANATQAAPAGRGPAGRYVALGDSFSSGVSVRPYAWGSDTPINHCYRSTSSYPALLARTDLSGKTFDFAACGGAVTADLYAPNHSGNRVTVDVLEPAQLDHVDRSTRAVTLTIGGNDMGFGQVIGACVYTDQQRATRKDCSTGPVRALVEARIAALDGRRAGVTSPEGTPITPLATVLRDIRRRAPHAAITIGTYPYLVAAGFSGTECSVGALDVVESPGQKATLYVGKNDIQWMTSVTNSLDSVIRIAPVKAGVRADVAEARDTFRYHGLCDAKTPWLTPVTGTVSVKTGAARIDGTSLHPTADGQKAYLRAFRRAD